MRKTNPLSKYTLLFELGLQTCIRTPKVLIGQAIFLVACLFIFSNLWPKISFITSSQLGHSELLWYITFNQWVLISIPELHTDIERDFSRGKIERSICTPVSYVLAKISEGLGYLAVNLLVLGVIAFAFTYVRTGFYPMNAPETIAMLILGIASGIVALTFQVAIGISSFWLQEVTAVNWLWEKLLFLFGGLFLPLFFYPEMLRQISYFTPFPFILGGRSALVIGNHPPQEFFAVFLSLICWGCIGCWISLMGYRRGVALCNG